MTAREHLATDVAQRRLIDAIASIQHRPGGAPCGSGDPLVALAFGVGFARHHAVPDDLASDSLAPVLAALETLILAVRRDIMEPGTLPHAAGREP
jgi:hypothetical protein